MSDRSAGIRRLIQLAEQYADDLAAGCRRPDGSWADDQDAEVEWHRWVGAIHQAKRDLVSRQTSATNDIGTGIAFGNSSEEAAINRALAQALAGFAAEVLRCVPPLAASGLLRSAPPAVRRRICDHLTPATIGPRNHS
jgi:hypothetical protein